MTVNAVVVTTVVVVVVGGGVYGGKEIAVDGDIGAAVGGAGAPTVGDAGAGGVIVGGVSLVVAGVVFGNATSSVAGGLEQPPTISIIAVSATSHPFNILIAISYLSPIILPRELPNYSQQLDFIIPLCRVRRHKFPVDVYLNLYSSGVFYTRGCRYYIIEFSIVIHSYLVGK